MTEEDEPGAETSEESSGEESAEETAGSGSEEDGAEKSEGAEEEQKKEEHKEAPPKKKKKDKKEKPPKKDPRDEKIAELNEKHLRLMAEFENFRRRSDKEKEAMFETGAKSVIEKILPVVDNFERALGMSGADSEESEESKDPFMDGMKMVYKQLMTELSSIGVEPIEAVGKSFDPALHNAVMQEESEELESGSVAKELQKGYTYRGSVVRHSMVSVVQ
ncbi:MAG: nucleotide exchange factor GrpE [Lachnospiraceae bacterium]|nr:nucleotide exchange factor GrpE [Lachnospiraceae bacterium]